ncbi:Uma2 family endonuclease [Streptomyces sp. NPDC102365]|uniref:Uma2 family endonuclease n=1 Tax=Streptomyces sp. NPDC102365 TaxID=3366162 RepID=UPI0038178CEC
MTHCSANAHHVIASCVQRALYDVIPEHWGIHQRLAVADPSRLGLYVPDLAVVPPEPLRGGDDPFVPAAAAELVVEITSKATADNDRGRKAAGHAWAGIPFHLLIDSLAPDGPTTTLYGEPEERVYRVLGAGGFGDTVFLPEPLHVDLGTSGFPVG